MKESKILGVVDTFFDRVAVSMTATTNASGYTYLFVTDKDGNEVRITCFVNNFDNVPWVDVSYNRFKTYKSLAKYLSKISGLIQIDNQKTEQLSLV